MSNREAAGLQPKRTMTRILIEYLKSGTVYWDATGDRLFDVALQILKRRVETGYIMPEETSQSLLDGLPDIESVRMQVDAIQQPEIRIAAQARLVEFLRSKDEIETEVRHARNANRAIENGDGKAAWGVLVARNGYEYEKVALEELTDGTASRSWDDCEDELEVVRNILRDAPPPDSLKDYDEWYDAMCDYLETT